MDDSMLGGNDEDDNLDDILEECNAQPDLQIEFSASAPITDQQRTERQPTTRSQDGGSTDPTIQAILRQNEMLMNAVLNQGQGVDKRKNQEEVSYNAEEPVLVFEESYRLEDDGHERIDTKLRQKLRPINVPPENYYTKGAFARVERPILGENM